MLEKSKISVVIADDHPMILKGLHDGPSSQWHAGAGTYFNT